MKTQAANEKLLFEFHHYKTVKREFSYLLL